MRQVVIMTSLLVASLLISAPVLAQERIELVGGVALETYVSGGMDGLFYTGWGASAGLRYWVNEAYAFQAGIDYLTSYGVNYDYVYPYRIMTYADLRSPGLVGGLVFRIASPILGKLAMHDAFVLAGSYGAEVDLDLYLYDSTGGVGGLSAQVTGDRRMGLVLGLESLYNLGTGGMKLGLSVAYRFLTFDSGTVNIGGLRQPAKINLDLSGLQSMVFLSIPF